jgi:hypothetical protein
MKVIVKNCHDCPFCNNDNEYGYSCNHPAEGVDVDEHEMTQYGETKLPAKCPLINGEVIVNAWINT